MKTLILYLLILGGILSARAQEVIELKEARVKAESNAVLVKSNLNESVYIIKDNGLVSFTSNPVEFMNQNFNIHDYIDSVKDEKYDSYLVSFKSTKGYLEATFDKKGELQKTYSRLQNILLPGDLRSKVYADYPGWVMTKNLHISGTRNEMVTKDFYLINLKNGNKNQKIKIASQASSLGVVSN